MELPWIKLTREYHKLKFKYPMPWKELIYDFFAKNKKGTCKDVSEFILKFHHDKCVLKAYTRAKLTNNFTHFEKSVYGSAFDEKLSERLNDFVKKGFLKKELIHGGHLENMYIKTSKLIK